jgi:hypothetical protein
MRFTKVIQNGEQLVKIKFKKGGTDHAKAQAVAIPKRNI